MAKDRSIYSRGLKKSEIPGEVYEQLRFEHDMHEGEISGLDAIMEDFSEDEVLERITELLSRFNLKEALDISWNPYEESNYANKFYEFVDYDYSEGGPTALVFFRDEDGNDLGAIVDLETEKILDASTWSGEGDEDVNLHLKVVEQLNQNKHIKDILRRWIHHINTDLVRRDLSEALDVSWNPYEDSNYTVLMGKIDTNKAVIQNYHAKDEDGALVEFFMDYLHQNLYYAKIAINGTKKNSFEKGTVYKDIDGYFFWIVVKGEHDTKYMDN